MLIFLLIYCKFFVWNNCTIVYEMHTIDVGKLFETQNSYSQKVHVSIMLQNNRQYKHMLKAIESINSRWVIRGQNLARNPYRVGRDPPPPQTSTDRPTD